MIDVFSFFFFKQKTAYEMRISDLSSDVCSSDLSHIGAAVQNVVPIDAHSEEMAVPHHLGPPVVERPLIANYADQVPVAVRQGLVVEKADRLGVAELGHPGRVEQLTLHGNIVDLQNDSATLRIGSSHTQESLVD